MPIYDYECQNKKCGKIEIDVMAGTDEDRKTLACGHIGNRLISMSGTNQNTMNQDTDWIHNYEKGAVAVFRNDDHPAAREFVKDPTRQNLNRVMKAKGLRHVENGESVSNDRRKRENTHKKNMSRLGNKLVQKAFQRRSINVSGQ